MANKSLRSPAAECLTPALAVTDLRVCLDAGDAIVESTDLRLAGGEILGLVGESGSGKTSTAMALLGYSSAGVTISGGTLDIGGRRLVMDESMRTHRGSAISYVPQNPGRSLNPSMRVIDYIDDVIKTHGGTGRADAAYRALAAVGLPATPEFGRRYPHQLSGGQQQRVCIAAALVCEPAVVVLDEPTTGLDVVSQARVLDELLRLRDEKSIAMVYVSHDLAVVAQIADRIAVMYAGRIVEQGSTRTLLRNPRHPYTRGLLASIPDHLVLRTLDPMPGVSVGVGERPDGCSFEPRCALADDACAQSVPALSDTTPDHQVRCLHPDLVAPLNFLAGTRTLQRRADADPVLQVENISAGYASRAEQIIVARDVSFSVARGECVALVGESGSGKTTIARAVSGLHRIAGGRMLLDGKELAPGVAQRTNAQRQKIQLVFQNPAEALNPRHSVADAIGRPAQLLKGLRGPAVQSRVEELLDQVRLPRRSAGRYPSELSGGERQRVAIARALAASPELILCDEITSALDVSVQAAVLELLSELRSELGVALLFITHNLGVVATVADNVLVLRHGVVCEQGPVDTVLGRPQHPYTRELLAAAPSLTAALTDSP